MDRLVQSLSTAAPDLPRWAAKAAAREILEGERRRFGAEAGPEPTTEGLVGRTASRAREISRARPSRVVNATGIVLHTNLGRSPMAHEGADAVARAAETYGDLEIDLPSGARGMRTDRVAHKLRLLSGAAGAHVVNNNAAAVLLVLATFARGRDVVVSRGELVEIGGSFRIPEILEASGARLVEVGTTNRTHLSDYERVIGPETALLLKVHRSNFDQSGFVAEVSLADLAELGRRVGLPVVEDLGSGTLVDLTARGWPPEAYAPARLRQGADVVCFSADKLLGGPQAGILLANDAARIEALRRNPLARALRIDKLTLAALDWTVSVYLEGRAERDLPVLRQLLESPEVLERRARGLAERLRSTFGDAVGVQVAPDRAAAGAGSLPGFELPTWVVAVRAPGGAERCAERLRGASPPVLARIREGALVLDVRTLLPGDEKAIESALAGALR